eukprot:2443195-Pyramimonas_sp.AAC.1
MRKLPNIGGHVDEELEFDISKTKTSTELAEIFLDHESSLPRGARKRPRMRRRRTTRQWNRAAQ